MSYQPRYDERDAYAYFKQVREVQHANNVDFLKCKGVHGAEPTESIPIPTTVSKNEAASYYRSLAASKLRHFHQIFNYNTLDKIEAHEPKSTVTVLESKLLDRFIKPEEDAMAQIDQADPDSGAAANPESLESMSGLQGPPPEGSVKDNIQQMKLYDTDAQNIDLARQKLMNSIKTKLEECGDDFDKLGARIQMSQLDAIGNLSELLNLEELDGEEFAKKAVELVGSNIRPAFKQGNPGDLPGSVRDANAGPMARGDEGLDARLKAAKLKYKSILGKLKRFHFDLSRRLRNPRGKRNGDLSELDEPMSGIQALTDAARRQLDLVENLVDQQNQEKLRYAQEDPQNYLEQFLRENGPQGADPEANDPDDPVQRLCNLRLLGQHLAEVEMAARANHPSVKTRIDALGPVLKNLGVERALGHVQLEQAADEVDGLRADIDDLKAQYHQAEDPREAMMLRKQLDEAKKELDYKQSFLKNVARNVEVGDQFQLSDMDRTLVGMHDLVGRMNIAEHFGHGPDPQLNEQLDELKQQFEQQLGQQIQDLQRVDEQSIEEVQRQRDELVQAENELRQQVEQYSEEQARYVQDLQGFQELEDLPQRADARLELLSGFNRVSEAKKDAQIRAQETLGVLRGLKDPIRNPKIERLQMVGSHVLGNQAVSDSGPPPLQPIDEEDNKFEDDQLDYVPPPPPQPPPVASSSSSAAAAASAPAAEPSVMPPSSIPELMRARVAKMMEDSEVPKPSDNRTRTPKAGPSSTPNHGSSSKPRASDDTFYTPPVKKLQFERRIGPASSSSAAAAAAAAAAVSPEARAWMRKEDKARKDIEDARANGDREQERAAQARLGEAEKKIDKILTSPQAVQSAAVPTACFFA